MKYGILDSEEIRSYSFWQSQSWYRILVESNQVHEIFYFGEKNNTWMLIEIRSIGLGFYGAFSLGVSSDQVNEDFSDWVEAISEFLRKKKVLFLQIEPIEEISNVRTTNLLNQTYKKFITPHTRTIDLNLSQDEILAQMHEKGRYNIRLAERRGVTVERVFSIPENIEIWMNLLSETTSRDGFSQNSQQYYESFLHEIEKEKIGGLYFAKYNQEIIAAGIFVFTKNRTIYYYGASSGNKEYRKHMAPYLLQWTAIVEAKERGIGMYDFLGVADPENPNDPLRGVTEFKEKFGGELSILPKKSMIILSPWRLFLLNIFRKIKSYIR